MENLYPFTKTDATIDQLPKYLIKLLEEANKEKPNPKIWRREKGVYDTDQQKWIYEVKEGEEPINKGIFDELWHPETYNSGIFKCAGWKFDFSKSWKNFLVHWKNYGWLPQKAPNKTFIREHSYHSHDIIRIIDRDGYEGQIAQLKALLKLAKKFADDMKLSSCLPDSYYNFVNSLNHQKEILKFIK